MNEVSVSTLHEIADELAALLDGPGADAAAAAKWYARASALLERMNGLDASVVDAIPHEIWHYVGDADLRMKQSEYLPDQLEAVRSFIACVRRRVSDET